MRTFIELLATDGGRIIVESAAILGIRTAPGKTKAEQGTKDAPVTIILRNAAPVEVMCIEPVMVLGLMCEVAEKADEVKERAGDNAPAVAIRWLDHGDADDGD